ncbi:sigma-70 family RNA polymerase sigma factor [Clostridium intestinale]|uniref:Sigma-70 family RNA polymerase sigma factor n=1 Tax=Clostridium intestinale TaxID=36845 RepID=A0A7D6VSS6_9CLOT|nr:sigma-70 family RNA polymerase sigma factor [Clostridium intestinale]QLY82247.1 sigma-70 family RNA polymerase sigma factor [Clostridium intestinale]
MNYIHEAKEFLRHYKDIKIANENLRYKIKELNSRLGEVKSMTISDMPKGGGGELPDDKLCNIVFERDKNIEALQKNSLTLTKATTILNKLDEESRKVLILSFIEDDKTDTEIARELKITRPTLNEKRKKALKKFSIQLYGIKAI